GDGRGRAGAPGRTPGNLVRPAGPRRRSGPGRRAVDDLPDRSRVAMKPFTPAEFARLTARYFRSYEEIVAFPSLSPEQIADAQLERLRRLIDRAYRGSEFYRQLYASHDIAPEDIRSWSDFRRLPTVTKDDIIERHDLVPIGGPAALRRARVSHSSGSS